MKIVKVKAADSGSEIFINLEHIDCIIPNNNTVNFSYHYVLLDDESMKKLVGLIEKEGTANETQIQSVE